MEEVSHVICLDSRIGSKFNCGVWWKLFPENILSLVYRSEVLNLPEVAEYWYQVVAMNDYQRRPFV